jgi:3-methyladenine DNA glycosylase Tag
MTTKSPSVETKREDWEKAFDCFRDSTGAAHYQIKDFIRDTRTQAIEEERERVKSIIQSAGPDLVCPINEPPFREDYINKWNLLTHLNKK